MINLLPEKEKQALKERKKMTRILIWAGLLAAEAVLLLGLLFGVNYFLSAKTEALKEKVSLKSAQVDNLKNSNFQTFIKRANANLRQADKFFKREILLSGVLEKLAVLTPSGIRVEELSFQKEFKKNKQGKWVAYAMVHLSGVARTREILFDFKNKLEEESAFQDVYFLPSSWVKPQNASFSLSFKVSLPK